MIESPDLPFIQKEMDGHELMEEKEVAEKTKAIFEQTNLFFEE